MARQYRLNLVEVKLREEDKEGLTYLKFMKLIRPSVTGANPGSAHTKVNALLGALWKDYKKQRGAETGGVKEGTSKQQRSPRGPGKKKKEKAKVAKPGKGSKPTVSRKRLTL